MHQTEQKMILAVCTGKTGELERMASASPQIDHPYLLGQLLFHRLGGMAYDRFQTAGLLGMLHREVRNTLKTVYESNVRKTERFLQAEAYLAEALQAFPAPYALLKGAYLVQRYPKGSRTSNDIDVFIEKKHIPDLETLLSAQGFRQGHIRNGAFTQASRAEIVQSSINRGETFPWVKKIGVPDMPYLELDLNFSLDYQARGTDAVGLLLRRTEALIQTEKGPLPTLSPPDFLIHLCAHLYKEASALPWVKMGRDLSLYKFCDILLFCEQFFTQAFAQPLVERIRCFQQETPCYYTLYYTRELFAISNPVLDEVLQQIRPADSAFLTRVYDPAQGASYSFDMDYADWIFCSSRFEKLIKIK